MKLTSIGVGNYRSIGANLAPIDLVKKINVLIGPNNSGKSNIFSALEYFTKMSQRKLNRNDYHRHDEEILPRIRFSCQIGTERDPFYPWFEFDVIDDQVIPRDNYYGDKPTIESCRLLLRERYIRNNKQIESMDKTQAQSILFEKLMADSRLYTDLINQIPSVAIVPHTRQLGREANQQDLSGSSILAHIADWQHPSTGMEKQAEYFSAIQDLLRKLIRLPRANLEARAPQAGGDTLIVDNEGLRLPIESYGTGVHEVIILAAALFEEKYGLLCIEEPEIHLHPALQRELLIFLKNEAPGKYLISTHSNVFIRPGADIQVVRITHDGSSTQTSRVTSSAESIQILDDLGVQASDILQANFVLWVEGPTDRIYIKHWLELMAPKINEGSHFTVMFYGGRLLSHLSFGRENNKDIFLIDMLKLNQRCAVVMDSDRTRVYQRLNYTKERIRQECASNGLFCWVTEYREIENYIPDKVWIEALGGNNPTAKTVWSADGKYRQIQDELKRLRSGGAFPRVDYEHNKVHYARKVIGHIETANMSSNLQRMIKSLALKIRDANFDSL